MKKKNGFTVAETLITIAIIGVISAIMLPLASHLRPNDTKTLYLKAYNNLSEILQTMTNNYKIYPDCGKFNDDNLNCSKYPLFNTELPEGFNDNKFQGDTKLCKLVSYYFNPPLGDKCSADLYTAYADNTVFSNSSFTTKDGMRWRISPQIQTKYTVETKKGQFEYVVYVDVNGEKKGSNCLYNKSTCSEPDIFKFLIDATGTINPADPVGEIYLKRHRSLTSKDVPESTGIITALADSVRLFPMESCKKTEITPEQDETTQEQEKTTNTITVTMEYSQLRVWSLKKFEAEKTPIPEIKFDLFTGTPGSATLSSTCITKTLNVINNIALKEDGTISRAKDCKITGDANTFNNFSVSNITPQSDDKYTYNIVLAKTGDIDDLPLIDNPQLDKPNVNNNDNITNYEENYICTVIHTSNGVGHEEPGPCTCDCSGYYGCIIVDNRCIRFKDALSYSNCRNGLLNLGTCAEYNTEGKGNSSQKDFNTGDTIYQKSSSIRD